MQKILNDILANRIQQVTNKSNNKKMKTHTHKHTQIKIIKTNNNKSFGTIAEIQD